MFIAVITAVTSCIIAITKGGSHFNHFFFFFNFSPPFYGFIITRYRVVCKFFLRISKKKKTLRMNFRRVFYIFNSQSMSPPAHVQEMYGSPQFLAARYTTVPPNRIFNNLLLRCSILALCISFFCCSKYISAFANDSFCSFSICSCF